MSNKITSTGKTTYVAKVTSTDQTTFVKTVKVGIPIKSVNIDAGDISALSNVDARTANHYDILVYDSNLSTWVDRDSANLVNLTLSGDLEVNDITATGSITGSTLSGVYQGFDSDLSRTSSASTIRGYFSATGDLSYDSSTGQFSFDVEDVYTKANFDSDFNVSLDEAALGGTGLTFDSSTNTLSITATGVDSGTYGSASNVPIFTVNTQGQLDSAGQRLIAFGDDERLRFGANPDLEIYHNSSLNRSLITAAGTGQVYLAGTNVYLGGTAATTVNLKTTSGQGVELNYNSQKKLETKSGGVDITGDLDVTGNITRSNTVDSATYGSASLVPVLTVNTSGFIDSIGTVSVAGVDSTSFDSATGILTINTADGGTFNTIIADSNFTNFRARTAISATDAGGDGSFSYNEGTGVFTYTGPSASEVRSHFSAQGDLSYDSSTGVFQFDVEDVYTKANFDSDFNVSLDEAALGGTGLTFDSSTNTLNITNTGVTAATYGSASQIPVFTVNAQGQLDSAGSVAVAGVTGLTYDSSTGALTISTADGSTFTDSINLNPFSTTDLSEGNNLYYTTTRADSDFDIRLATKSTSDVSEGSNLYYTTARADSAFDNRFDSSFDERLATKSTSDLSEGSNLYYTTARADSDAKNAISLTFTGGDGAASYTPATGVISVTGPSAAEVRAHLSGGTGITYNSSTGVITTTDSDIVHDNLSGFVANEHINHTSVSITAGKGLTGGGTIASTRTIDIDSANVRGMFSGGTGVTYTSGTGQIAIGQDVGTTSDVTFGAVTGDSFSVGEIAFQTDFHDSHIPFEEGALWYDPYHKNLNYYTDFDHPIEIGLQIVERVYNNNAYTINKGQPLYYSGNRTDEGGRESPTVGLANATSATKYNVQGLAAEDIPASSYGQIVVAGVIDGFDTSSLTAGLNFFAGLTDGAVQNAAPTYPNYPMCLGWVIKSDATDGKVIINQQNHSVNTFRVQGDTHIGDDLIVDGNLTVNGTQTITSTENVSIGGNIQYLNAGDTIGEAGTTFVGSGLDDAFYSGHYQGDSSSKSFFVKIDATGTPDTFEWGFDSSVGTQATGVAITGEAQLLDSDAGISIDFGATTGHTVGDKWVGTATAINTDTGLFSNKNEGDAGNGYTHVGLYWDASQDEWTFVGQYDSEPEAPINRSAPSFAYGDVRGKDFYGTNFTGALVGNANTATEATNVTVSANNTANETVYLTFVDGATGTQGIETDTGLTYNPSTGLITTTSVTASGDVTVDSAGGFFFDVSDKSLNFGDNYKAKFGASDDLEIFHNGSLSHIRDLGTGELRLSTNGTQIRFYDTANNRTMAQFLTANGSAALWYNDSSKFETTAYGATVTGTINADSATLTKLTVSGVNAKGIFGSFAETSFPDPNDRPLILVDSSATMLIHRIHPSFDAALEMKVSDSPGASLDVYWDIFAKKADKSFVFRDRLANPSHERLIITHSDSNAQVKLGDSSDLFIPDKGKIIFGDGNDFDISFNGTNQVFKSTVADNSISFQPGSSGNFNIYGGGQFQLKAEADAEVSLWYDGTKRLETTAYGATVTGTINADSATISGDVSATTFTGSGANLTNLPAGNLTGTIDSARIPSLATSDIVTGVFDSARIPSLATSDIVTGVFDSARIPFIPGGDADTLDGINSTSFLRSDQDDTMTGILTISGSLTSDSATIPRIVIQESADGDFAMSNLGDGRVDFGYPTTFGPAIEMYNKNSGVSSGTRKGRIGLTYGGIDGTGDIIFTHRTSSTWVQRGVFDAYGNFQMDGQLDADSATITGNIRADGGNLILGQEAYTASSDFVGIKTSDQTGSQDYMIISGVNSADGSTYVSAKNGSSAFIRGGGNSSTHQLGVSSSQARAYGDFAFDSSGAILFDKSDQSLKFGDNYKAKFGTSDDLLMYHSGTASIIRDAGVTPLYLQSNNTTNGVVITKVNATETMAKFIADGAVELYYNDTLKVKTDSDGMRVAGIINQPSGIILEDPSNTAYGGHISFYDGTSYEHFTNGEVVIGGRNNTTRLKNIVLDRDTDTVRFPGDVQFDSAGGILFDKSDQALEFGDNYQLRFGDGTDLKIYHQASSDNSFIQETGSGSLKITASQTHILNAANDTYLAKFIQGGAVELNYNGTTRFVTTDSGATVTGSLLADSASVDILNIPTGSGTGNRIQVGDDLVLFDDGNAHIHSKNSTLWLNAETGGTQVRINNQYDGAVYLSRPSGDGVIIKEHYDLTSDSSQLTSITETSIASFAKATYSGGKFIITAFDHTASERQITELLVVHNGDSAYATEYGTIYTNGELASFDVDISGTDVRVLATSASTNATTYQVAETLMRI